MRLEEKALFVIQNSSSLGKEDVAQILRVIKKSSISHLGEVFSYIGDFIDKHGKAPTFEYLQATYNMERVGEGLEFSCDYITTFLQELREEVVSSSAALALAKGDFEAVGKLVASVKKVVNDKVYSIGDVEESYRELKSRPTGIHLGIPELDELLKGLSYGTMTVIAAPPTNGKSSLATSALYNAVFKNGFNFIELNMELMPRDVYFNFIARHSFEMGVKLSAESLKKGLLSEKEEDVFRDVVEDWKKNCKGRLEILSPSDIGVFDPHSLDRVWEKYEELMGSVDGILVDYVQLLRYFRPKGAAVDEFLNDCVRYFSNLAISYNGKRGLISILLSQINREGSKRIAKRGKADLTSFAEINSLERDAHAAVVLYSDETMRMNNTIKAQIVKNRSGRVMDEMISTLFLPESFVIGSGEYKEIFGVESAALIVGDDSSSLF